MKQVASAICRQERPWRLGQVRAAVALLLLLCQCCELLQRTATLTELPPARVRRCRRAGAVLTRAPVPARARDRDPARARALTPEDAATRALAAGPRAGLAHDHTSGGEAGPARSGGARARTPRGAAPARDPRAARAPRLLPHAPADPCPTAVPVAAKTWTDCAKKTSMRKRRYDHYEQPCPLANSTALPPSRTHTPLHHCMWHRHPS